MHFKSVNFAIPLTALTDVVPVRVHPAEAATLTLAVLLETVPPLESPIAIQGCVANKDPEDPPIAF